LPTPTKPKHPGNTQIASGLVGLPSDTVDKLISEARNAIFVARSAHGPAVEIAGPKPKFQVFAEKEERDAIVKASISLAKYTHDNSIPTIVFIDVRGRSGYLPFIHAWRKLYGSEQRPEIYFISPSEMINKVSPGKMNFDSVLREFNSRHGYLAARKDRPVMVYDTCMHTGNTMMRVVKLLEAAGFTKIQAGIAEQGQFGEPVVGPSFILFGSAHETCSIYGASRTQLVLRGFGILSSPNKIKEDIADGIQARWELAEMLREAKL
jgi:hypothetical protein